MNGDMPHVPITTLAGIASLTDLLNQLPLPSPLPATTAKSLLYNGRISEEVSSLLVCRDENLVTQLAHSLNQVSTEHIELKDNLGNDEPEGDMPILLQTLLSRNPRIFRDKSVLQQPLIQQYKISQNQVHGSPGLNYQQTTVAQSPSGCFSSPQSGSATQFVPQQNSPIPSPYTPQSPADYIQYNPPSYSHHQQTQQVSSGVRNIHDSKVSGQLSSNSSNHNTRLASDEDYMNVAHRLGNEENESSVKAAAFSVKSSRPVCSPAGREETAKMSRPSLIMQSPSPDVPQGAAPDLLLSTPDRKKKQRGRSKEENDHMDKNALYDIVSSPSKDSTKLTIKLSRVKIPDVNQSEEHPPVSHMDSDPETVRINSNNIQLSNTPQDFSHKFEAEELANCQQVAMQPNSKDTGIIGGIVFDDSEMDAVAEIERIERESASERERCSKEVQDKDKPLKKRKQDTYPQEPGIEASEGPTVHSSNSISKLTPKKSSTASNGASRPALMVSIDLQRAGRVIGQPVVILEPQPLCEDHIRRLKRNADGKVNKNVENQAGIKRQLPETPQKSGLDSQLETQKQESHCESKQKHDSKSDSDKGHPDDRQPDMTRQKHDRHSDLHNKEENNNSRRSHAIRPEIPKTGSKADNNSIHEEAKSRDLERVRGRERQRDSDGDRAKLKDKYKSRDKDRVKYKDTDKDREKGRERDKDTDREKGRDRDKDTDKDREKGRERDKDTDREKGRDRDKDTDREKGRDRDKDTDTDREKGRDRDKDTAKDREKGRDRNKDTDTDREKGRDRDKDTDKDREKGRERDKDTDREKGRERDKDTDKNREKGREKNREKGRERDKDGDRDREKGRKRDKDSERDKEDDRERQKVRDKDRERDKGREKDVDRDKEREKVNDREIDKDRDRSRKQKTLSRENCNRASPDRHSKADSPKMKQDGSKKSPDINGRQRTSSSSLQTSKNKEHRTSGFSSISCLAGNKQQAYETKLSEFPSYLLGGNSGSLKNFVIPKLKQEGTNKDLQLKSKLLQSWSEPLVRLERVSLIKNLNKRAKPVVLLQRLGIEDVKRIIKESRNAHSSRYKNWSSDKSARETYFEKANKRRHSMVSKRSKYVEVDSDVDKTDDDEEESDSDNESARKRFKKNHDKTWKFEEKRGSRDHHRSGGFNSRRGSGGRHREWDGDDSDEGSPPQSLNDYARKMKKEKHKNKMAYSSMTLEEKIDSSTFKRFASNIDGILENLEDVDLTAADEDDEEIPQELLLGKQQLSELGSDSTKIKAMGVFNKFSSSKLVKVLNILEKNIQDSVKLSTMMSHDKDAMDEERLWRDLIMERVTKSADACLTALNIMTSPHMPKAVYIEDVIERVLQFTKFHLQNTLYPQYDSSYRVDRHGGGTHTSKSKRAKSSTHKQKVVVSLYNKVCDIISNISELLEIQLLTDTTVLQVSNLGITPFFVENVSELQLCAITLVTAVFCRYKKHRQLVLEEIFTSLAKLPTSKRNLRNFRLNSSDSDGEPLFIQMVSALVLQLIQCVVHFPSEKETDDEHNKKVDKDALITNSYETAMRTAQNFLSVFLKKCGSKQGEEDYRPLFENFVHDLLSAVNKPEWPAAELLLSLLGRLLVHQFSNKQTEMALRVASLDYLGTVASRLRKDAVSNKMDQRAIDRILEETPGSNEIQQLQKALVNFLDENTDTDPALVFARNFYIAQWFRDSTTEAEKAIKSQNENDEDTKGRRHSKDIDSSGEIMQRAEAQKKFLRKVIKTSNFSSAKMNSNAVDYEDSCLIVRYLASMRPFAQSFDIYLSQILRVLGESAIAVRTKAMKCLSEVVAVDPSILARLDMQRGVHCRLMDNSTSVREAAVELLGRFVLSRPELIEQYYDMLIERILDTGISVRKRVIKILRDICLEHPDFHKITEMCVKMIRRVNDEEGIKKLVNETFQKLWFSPTPSHDKDAMTRKILNITDVVLACKDSGYDWFEQLLQNLLKSEENASYKPTKKACIQLVDNLVEHILKYEESLADCEDKGVNSGRLVACITTLYLFTKIRAQLMVKHAMTMQPYLTTKCNTQNDFVVICNVSKILELVVPLMEHPSETFLTTLEEDLMKLIIKYGMTVVQHCVSCLGAIVNKVTHNYKFVWACFNRYYGALAKLKTQHQEDPGNSTLATNKPTLLRSLFTVGALCRHFDFDQEEFKGPNKIIIKDKVLDLLLYFTTHEEEEVQIKAIIGLGFQFIMHPELMFVQDVKVLYNSILSDENSVVNLKIQVLKNLQTYLQDEDTRMQEADREWKNQAKQEDLKEMGDISSGMSSSIMQIYLKQVLESFFHSQSSVRHFALNVITLTLSQGLIHPVQCVPYLIAMGTDPEPTMKNKADQQLVEIDKKYSGFIHMKAVAGLKMSYQVQQAINGSKKAVIRGFRHDDSDAALCSHLYTMVRGNRQHRRAFLISLLNLFDDSSKTEVNMLLFIADNLACFPFQTQEEPLFIMHHIDITLSVSGSNLLQSFKECLQKQPVRQEKKVNTKKRKKHHSRRRKSSSDDDSEDEDEKNSSSSSSSSSSDEDDDEVHRHKKTAAADSDSDMEDEDAVMDRLPENTTPLLEFASASQGILLLLVLKQHLKNLYGFSDSKIQKYSPTESAKVYDKAVNRKSKVHFNPALTLDYLKSDLANRELSYEAKRNIVKQYLDFKVLMEHLDRDEEDEEGGEANANARNKAITSLLKGSKPRIHNHSNHTAPVDTDDDESEDDDPPARKPRKGEDSAEDSGHMNKTVDVRDVIAICCPKYKDRPQIARVVQKTRNGYSIHWMTGTYSGPWAVAKKRDGRKKVPWVDNIKESDIIYKKIFLTSGQKLTNKVAQTLRALYAAKEGTKS
ncbi:nipped-B-like protein B [Melanotaenia boesemani]|uniref:nipped-B-like protein B n=1 Tax=Melanotaenia boesemani TaxID=1250792 RepID=UPI001C05E5AD|nr:nipped-B-like protein B [Melanotaenia boesemani]XP_041825131.1 nipped-B-like protein B [Melanotaenia boesemani]XP_041825132.1 nipped-B-like protein B [Melanotaenia boesemani]